MNDKLSTKMAFKSLLTKHGAYHAYLSLLRYKHKYNNIDDSTVIFNDFTSSCKPTSWVCGAGDWYQSYEGVHFWRRINTELSYMLQSHNEFNTHCNSIW